MKDEAYPLEVELSYRAIPECDLIERSTRIVNRGEADIVLENAQSAAWVIPYLADYRLTHVTGNGPANFRQRPSSPKARRCWNPAGVYGQPCQPMVCDG